MGSLAKLGFKELISLDVSNNALRDLRDLSAAFPALQNLLCSQNPITNLDVGRLSHLLELCGNKCQLTGDLKGLQGCARLTKLSLSANKLRSFPELQVRTVRSSLVEFNSNLQSWNVSEATSLPIQAPHHLSLALQYFRHWCEFIQ